MQRCYKNDMEQIKKFIGFNADFVGSLAAIICAIHCMIFPVLLSVGLVNTTSHNHAFDFIFMAGGLLIALYVLVKDAMKHKNMLPSFLALIGFVTLFFGVESHGELFFLSVTGGILITIAHYHNWKLTHQH